MAAPADRIVQFYEEVVNANAIDRVDEFCTEDFVDHEEIPGIPPGREGVKQFFQMMRAGFPDLNVKPESVIAEGDRVMARFRMTGTHDGEFMGIPPSGRRVDITGYDEVRLVDDRAAEHWGATDFAALLQQIGAMPEPAPAA